MRLRSDALPDWPDPTPRVASYPARADWGAGEEAVELAAVAGLELDVWQQWCLKAGLGAREDRSWASFEVGLEVPRQDGKGAILEARELAGLFLFGERLLIHTAHEFKTAQEAFHRIKSLVENTDALRRKVKRVRTANGDEGIELLNGSRLRFLARSGGSGRGFSGDLVILDEAMYLPTQVMGALLPTLSARSNVTEGGPQLWYAGSAGYETSEVWDGVRRRGVDGRAGLCYVEYAAGDRSDHDGKKVDLDDRAEWFRANPAMHGPDPRITVEFVEHERDALDDEQFARERLCIWDQSVVESVISAETWARLGDKRSEMRDPVAFAVEVSWDRSHASIGVAGHRRDGRGHLELVDRRRGTSWAVDRLVELDERWEPKAVVVDPAAPAGALIPALQEAGIEPLLVTSREFAQSCGWVFDCVQPEEDLLRHRCGTAELAVALSSAVENVSRRPLGDAWAWNRRNLNVDVTPLCAVTLALHGVGKPSKRRKKSGKAVFL